MAMVMMMKKIIDDDWGPTNDHCNNDTEIKTKSDKFTQHQHDAGESETHVQQQSRSVQLTVIPVRK